jgi:hypothetical protein
MPAVTSLDDLAAELAAAGCHLDAGGWRDLLLSPPEVQARILETVQTSGVPKAADYWPTILAILTGAVSVASAVSGVGSAIVAVQSLAKL